MPSSKVGAIEVRETKHDSWFWRSCCDENTWKQEWCSNPSDNLMSQVLLFPSYSWRICNSEKCLMNPHSWNQKLKPGLSERPSRWQRTKTWRSPSSPQIHQKYIYMWNNSYRTPTERWQKTSDLPKNIFFFFSFCECVCVCFFVWFCLYSFAFTICPRVLSVWFFFLV